MGSRLSAGGDALGGLLFRACPRATLKKGRLVVSGTISKRARGVVRVRLGYVDTDGTLAFLRLRATITNGKWSLDEKLTGAAAGGGQLSIQITGYRASLTHCHITHFSRPPARP